jgi:PhnB protein
MSTNPIPASYQSATPYIIVNDASAAINFYQSVFGASEFIRLADPSGKVMHAELRIGSAAIMLADEFPEMGYRSPSTLGGSPVSLLLYVKEVDAVFARAIAADATQIMPVSDQFDGDRRGTLRDPFGHIWLLASKVEEISPEEIQRRFEKMMGEGSA